MTPRRIQRKRTKGWRMPENAVYVGRPTKWGNPFAIGSNQPDVFVFDRFEVVWSIPRSETALTEARAEAVRLFRGLAAKYPHLISEGIQELRGKDLVCWCPLDEPCHADVLLEWANQ